MHGVFFALGETNEHADLSCLPTPKTYPTVRLTDAICPTPSFTITVMYATKHQQGVKGGVVNVVSTMVDIISFTLRRCYFAPGSTGILYVRTIYSKHQGIGMNSTPL